MRRREFLNSSLAASLGVAAVGQLSGSAESRAAEKPAESLPLFVGHPVVSGPAPESLSILQSVNGPASGYLELAVGDGEFQKIQGESAGLLPYDQNVLKFVLPPLPVNSTIRYRVVARTIHFQSAYKIHQGEAVSTEVKEFRTLNPDSAETKFTIWNDTHENQETIKKLVELTDSYRPDFLLWNGDQSNDIYDPAKMRAQYLAPSGLEISSRWPLAYARGNHDVRGPAARELSKFTGNPDNRFYYGFRSGPVAVLVMDTGEDKPDDRAVFAGLAGFEAMRERQRQWLAKVIEEDWFKSAPYRVLFCHIPLWFDGYEPPPDFWIYSEVCRNAWVPLLQQGGVQLVVSGHTHRAHWMPKSETQPLPQLVGGGPKIAAATIMEGTANESRFVITSKSLDGQVLHEVMLPPLVT